jgi:hypothetical protein
LRNIANFGGGVVCWGWNTFLRDTFLQIVLLQIIANWLLRADFANHSQLAGCPVEGSFGGGGVAAEVVEPFEFFSDGEG